MTIETIREIVGRKPWRPLEILVDGGEKVRVRHPESLFVGRTVVLVEEPDGSFHFFEPDSISKIRRLPRNGR